VSSSGDKARSLASEEDGLPEFNPPQWKADCDVSTICDGCYGVRGDRSTGNVQAMPVTYKGQVLLLQGGDQWMKCDGKHEDSRLIGLDPLEQDAGLVRNIPAPDSVVHWKDWVAEASLKNSAHQRQQRRLSPLEEETRLSQLNALRQLSAHNEERLLDQQRAALGLAPLTFRMVS